MDSRLLALPFLLALSGASIACSGDSDGTPEPRSSATAGGASGADGADGAGGESGAGGQGGGGTGGAGQAGAAGGGAAGAAGAAGAKGSMCAAACSHEHDACPSETVEGCVYTCAKTANKYPGCSGELHTLLECQSKVPVSCKAGGGVDFGTACDGETVSYAQCAACEITPKDSLCAACSKDNCCKESRALVAAPGGAAYESCTKACKNAPACTEQCKQSYPEAATAASVVGACVTSSCPASCQTGAPGDDTLSIYCKKALETGCSGSATLGGCLKQVRIDAAVSGCEGAYYQKLSCAIENGISCTAGEIDLGIACNAFFESSCSP